MNSENQRMSDEVSLKDLILKVRELFYVCLKNWIWLVLFSALFAGFFLYSHYKFEKTYSTQLKFIIEGQSQSGGGLGGLLGQIGISKPGGTNPYKVLVVAKSNKMMEQLFKNSVEDKLMPNKIIEVYEMDKAWKESGSSLEGFRFDSINNGVNNEAGRRAFMKLKSKIWGSESDNRNALLKIDYNMETGVFIAKSQSKNESLSVNLVNSLFHELKRFFETEIFKTQLSTITILEAKTDSIQQLRDSKIVQLAQFKDNNRNLINSSSGVRRAMLEREIQSLSIAYTDLIRNQEMADFNLKDMKPLFIAIDEPMTPIRPSSSSLLKSIAKGILFGAFFGALFVIIRKIIRDALASDA